jgi:hypothetical protein
MSAWYSVSLKRELHFVFEPTICQQISGARCARAASGHVTTALPTTVMNSRRLMQPHHKQEHTQIQS